MNDQQASVTLEAVLELAVAVRDEGPDGVAAAAERVLAAAGGDPLAAVTVAAALVRAELPVDRWWQRGLAGVGSPRPERVAPPREGAARGGRSAVQPCGTYAAYVRHQRRGEQPDEACEAANRAYKTARRHATAEPAEAELVAS